MENAKRNLSLNIATNLLVVLLSGIVGLFMTPFFIKSLGVSNYSVIPLFSSLIVYISFFASIISSSVGRFSSVCYNNGDGDGLNKNLSTAFFAMIVLSILFIAIAILVSLFVEKILTIPEEILYDSKYFLVFNVISFCFVAISTPLLVSTFLKHKFYLANFIKISSRILQPSFILLFFFLNSASVYFIGVSNLLVNIFYFLSSLLIFKKLMPNTKILPRHIDSSCFKDMATMGSWSFLNSLGALLYTNIDLILISYFLGSEACGKYAPLVQIIMLFALVVDALCDVLTPVVYEYVMAEKFSLALTQTRRASRYIGIFMILPVAALCVFSREFLSKWLGAGFEEMAPVLILLLLPAILIHPIRPVMAISKAANKVKLPAIVTILGGVLNLILSIIFIKFTQLGVYGVGLATVVSLVLKNLVFSATYSAHIIGKPWYSFYRGLFESIVLFIAALILYSISRFVFIEYNNFSGIGLFIFFTWFFVISVYGFVFDKEDKSFVKKTILRIG